MFYSFCLPPYNNKQIKTTASGYNAIRVESRFPRVFQGLILIVVPLFQSELYSSMTSHDSSIVSADHSSLYTVHKESNMKELLKQKIILFDSNETRL